MADGEVLMIKIRAQDNNEISFKVKSKTPFQKIFNAYVQKTGQDVNLLRFVYEGERVRAEHTPVHHGMEDGAVVDAFVEQQGGGVKC